jgi:SAM-dependent methyltransferase
MNRHRAQPIVLLACLLCGFSVAPSHVRGEPPAKGKPTSEQDTQAKKPYQPQFGQEGKDVVWVPTADTMVSQMLDMAKVGPGDYVIDLGSGDGRMVIAAARRGAQAHGVEFNPDMVELARKNANAAGVTRLATYEKGDLFEADLSKATVVTMFLMDWINLKLRPSLLQLKPGTRIVSNTFSMADWTADERVQVTDQCVNYCTALLWIVPGKAEGTWQLSPGRLTLTQTFQKVSGALAAWGATRPVTGGRLRGNQLTFSVGASQYDVRVMGNTMEGTVTTGSKSQAFRATQIAGK